MKTKFEYLTQLSDAARLAAQTSIHNGKEPPSTTGHMLAVALQSEEKRAALTVEEAQADAWMDVQQAQADLKQA